MSSIFKLLDTIGDSDREQLTNPLVRSKTYNELKPNKGGMESAKPKGLSLRSHSDMNVSQRVHSSSAKRNILSNKDQDCQKLKVTQIDSNGCPISPGKETKKLLAQSSKPKEHNSLSKEEITNSKCTKTTPMSSTKFKTPLLSKSITKKFPYPEKLAHWYDDQHEFDYGYIDEAENEFKELLLKGKENIMPYRETEETKFKSDSRPPIVLEIPKLDRCFNDDYKKTDLLSLGLPEVSDLSDASDDDTCDFSVCTNQYS
ncbi:uncharacterized protein LOC109854838 isoform X1 [Pseudomyrmex gracilis]|uniref:uncharacterized protein LOC109854838 isoform X1 n=1 Tax=Pseudomyrmex gracilis TaxID=219809 RepID=UPI000994FA49|nr:uncharacterized protein LOC109854838 isoform X1 [Pseudomyrmex gracilis]